jgi:mRNA interferase MazF
MLQVGEIILIPFPFTDLSAQKKRPILVISEVDANNDFIALAITSKQKEDVLAKIRETEALIRELKNSINDESSKNILDDLKLTR